jgi:hypothetical protein
VKPPVDCATTNVPSTGSEVEAKEKHMQSDLRVTTPIVRPNLKRTEKNKQALDTNGFIEGTRNGPNKSLTLTPKSDAAAPW